MCLLRRKVLTCAQRHTHAGTKLLDALWNLLPHPPAGKSGQLHGSLCQTAPRMSVCSLTNPGCGAKAKGNGLGLIPGPGTDVIKFLGLLALHFTCPLSSPGHICGICFPLGPPVVKGLVPRSGIQTAKSASGLKRVPQTM